MAVPTLLSTSVQNEKFGGVTYHIEGELVPALHMELSNAGVYFEHHILLWKDPAVQVAIAPDERRAQADAGRDAVPADRRERAGPHRVQPRRRGTRPGPAPETRHGGGRARASMAGGDRHVEYTFSRVRGVANMLLGGTGFFIDNFPARPRKAFCGYTVLAMFLKSRSDRARRLTSNQADGSIKTVQCRWRRCSRDFRRGYSAATRQIFWNRFTGPGKLALQSMYYHMESGE